MEEITEFVNMMSRQGYNTDLSRGSFSVDAKSILGVIALGLGLPRYYPCNKTVRAFLLSPKLIKIHTA